MKLWPPIGREGERGSCRGFSFLLLKSFLRTREWNLFLSGENVFFIGKNGFFGFVPLFERIRGLFGKLC